MNGGIDPEGKFLICLAFHSIYFRHIEELQNALDEIRDNEK